MACHGRGEEAGKNRTEAKTGGSKKQSELQEVVPSMFGFGDEKEVTSLHLSLFCMQFIFFNPAWRRRKSHIPPPSLLSYVVYC